MKTIVILTHYYYPDSVAAAMQYYQLSHALAENDFNVLVLTSNRCRHNPIESLDKQSKYRNIKVIRFFRPSLDQNKIINKLITAIWMTFIWSVYAIKNRDIIKPSLIITGTDPPLSLIAANFWSKNKNNFPKHLHWCFDLFPDTAIEDGILKKGSLIHKILSNYYSIIYDSIDLIVDSSSCQRKRIQRYLSPTKKIATCNPWALIESNNVIQTDYQERAKIFGNVNLAFLYSGSLNLGRNFRLVLELASDLGNYGCKIGFASKGQNVDKIKSHAIKSNISLIFLDLVPLNKLEKRLSTIDFSIVLLDDNWTGTLIPSKFFGSIALGRPVIYCGSDKSSIAELIRKYNIGFVLNKKNYHETVKSLIDLTKNTNKINIMKDNSFKVYQKYFSNKIVTNRFINEIKTLMNE